MKAINRYNHYIKIRDDHGNFTRVVKLHRFKDTMRKFYIEPKFVLSDGKIARKDGILEGRDIIGVHGCGFIPSSLKEFREYCRAEYQRFKDEEVIESGERIAQIAAALGGVNVTIHKQPYDDKAVTSTKYHV